MAKQKTFPDTVVLSGAQKLRELLAAGADIHDRDGDGRTPLFRVCRLGQLEKTLILLQAGADPNAHDAHGEAPLQSAGRYGHVDCVEVLLKAGALIDYCPPSSITDFSESALYSAARKSPEVAKLLLAHGADPNAATDAKRYPLFAAIKQRNAELVALLLKHKASVAARDLHGCTPLHVAMQRHASSIVTMLLNNGADPNAKNDRGETPIFAGIAKDQEALATVLALLRARPDLSIKDKVFKETPLKQAISRGVTEIAEALRNAGSPPAPPEPVEEDEFTINLELTEEDFEAAIGVVENSGPDWCHAIGPVDEQALIPTEQDNAWASQVDLEVQSLSATFGPSISKPHWELLRHAKTALPLTRMAYFARGHLNAPAGRELEDGLKVLGESYEAAADGFVTKGFLKRVSGPHAIQLAFSQADLTTIARQNLLNATGAKPELAERLFFALGDAPFNERLCLVGGYFELTPSGSQEASQFAGKCGAFEMQQRQEAVKALLALDFLRAAKCARVLALMKKTVNWVEVKTAGESIARARFIRASALPSSLRFIPGSETHYLAIAAANVMCRTVGDDWHAWDPAIEEPKTNQGESVKLNVFSAALLGEFQ